MEVDGWDGNEGARRRLVSGLKAWPVNRNRGTRQPIRQGVAFRYLAS